MKPWLKEFSEKVLLPILTMITHYHVVLRQSRLILAAVSLLAFYNEDILVDAFSDHSVVHNGNRNNEEYFEDLVVPVVVNMFHKSLSLMILIHNSSNKNTHFEKVVPFFAHVDVRNLHKSTFFEWVDCIQGKIVILRMR